MNNELNFESNKPQVLFDNPTNDLQFQAPQNVVGGTTNYKALSNKPKINGVELIDDKTLEDLGLEPVDLSNYYTKEEIDGSPFARMMASNGNPSVSISRSQDISLVDYINSSTQKGLFVCYVQSGTKDNPPKSEAKKSSLRGIFYIHLTTRENGKPYAWVILFDQDGEMYTRYIKGATVSNWANVGIPDSSLTLKGTSADAKAVGDKITELNNSISEKASIQDMTNYIEENKADLKGDKGEKGEQGIQGEKGEKGETGEKGQDGKDGYTPVKGVDYFDGKNGTNGVDGKTPVKGTDYYTEADKQEMVNLVLKEIPTSEGVAELMTLVTYEELKTLRDNAELVAGMFYKITDYVTTSIQEATQSAGHQFDIIVRALDEKTLDEEAKAIQSENDEYFANSNLTGWQVWYTLDNDTSRYAWASENGKGVIYRLIDENGNDVPYDFKNIQMLDANNSEDTTYYYTFDSKGVDHSLNGSLCFNNVINKYISGTQRVNRIIFKCNNAEVSTNFFDFECYNNTMGSCDHMKFGRECYGNVFGGMNHLCTFNTKFRNNVVGSETQSIQVGQGASNNNFANCIYYSTFGNYFRNNKVCEYTYYSSFGHYVQNFIMGKNADELGQCMRYLTIENGVTYVNLYKKDATTKKYMENIKICSGTCGSSSNRINIEVEELAQKYAIVYGNNSKGELKKYCVADFTDIPIYEDGDEVSY